MAEVETVVPTDCHRCAYAADMGREIVRLRNWKRAYAKGRAGMVQQADLDHAEAERLMGEVERLRSHLLDAKIECQEGGDPLPAILRALAPEKEATPDG